MKDFKVGDKIYTIESISDRVVKAKVKEIIKLKVKEDGDEEDYFMLTGLYKMDDDESTDMIGSFGCALDNIYHTKEEAIDAQKAEYKSSLEAYKHEITDVSSLVQFCLGHCVAYAEEYTDYAAREAATQKAKEFGLGI